ncbi:MAG: hypothetical protein A2408_02530 [Candidatus Yonathbacteria bacterium RIFOXYC1_FULL_52_10]|uniref:ATP synthase F1 complex delta/epsilon subunit N-terminal domain-containing protein n=1 Tax=Candidatus Yonathbacteria bacterium RIFOXYD1_FULL_52_36 TaxID=1802730 RepID=A0A1G2SKW2_9BACT|nr:MAG: hypothetical protein A2408_02530 [Candidatus Yonathbacteria bacterium RIFOXYC1_FULL_52_10]OHA85725.1 MAG: hypothetical protein A2591_02110 [Candidatus Yonathbacteria bacterium RIFOXYD1_FULL_52_36]
MSTFPLTIATVDKTLFHGAAVSVNVPGSDGELTVLAHHTPLVTTLIAGEIRVKTEHDTLTFPIERGLLEVSRNEAVVLL